MLRWGFGIAGQLGLFAALGGLLADAGAAQGAVHITPTTLPNWTVGSSYSQTLTASGCGAGCTWSFTGNLPVGLAQSPASGTISGIPLLAGDYSFTVTATSGGGAKGSQSYTVAIHTVPTITTSALPDGAVGAPYSQTIGVTNGTPPYTFAIKSGSLPPGLSLGASSGAVSGTPTAGGASSFTVAATDQAGVAATATYTLTVSAPLTITTSSPLPPGTAGTVYSQSLAASGGTPPLTWGIAAGALPAGLTLNASSGVLSGTPAAAVSSAFTVQVSDSKGARGTKDFTLSITPAIQSLSITNTSPLPAGTVGNPYSQTLAATGGSAPYTWSLASGNLPAGVSLNSSSGALAGTPTTAGTFNFTAQVTDNSGGSTTKAFSVSINPSNLTITNTSPLPGGTAGSAYSQTLAASGGQPPYSWSVMAGSLPAGLSLSAAGNIAGTPTTAGTASFTVQASDSASGKATQQFSITISATPTISSLAIAGVPPAAASAQQIPFGVNLSAPQLTTVTGQVTLTFQAAASVNKDDPSIQFSTGGRTVNFTIPAGSVHATFPSSSVALQTGTVAGTIKLDVTSNMPNGTTSSSTAVGETAPVISSASVTTNASGFQVQIAGYSNSLDLSSASFHFTAQSGQIVQTGDLTADLTKPASQWYGGSGSSSFGGQFLIVVPFTVQQGAASGLASVSVQLQNGKGASAAVSAKF